MSRLTFALLLLSGKPPCHAPGQNQQGPDVNVDGYERPKEWDLVFMIRAYPYSPRQHSTVAHLAELDAAGLVTACSD